MLCGLAAESAILLASRPSRGSTIQPPEAPPEAGITVDVIRAVAQLGVYVLPAGSRVEDAITAAGGLLSYAYQESLNMTAHLADGSKLLVPLRPGGSESMPDNTHSKTTVYGGGFPININTASRNTLTALPRFGETKAQAIIAQKTAHSPPQSS